MSVHKETGSGSHPVATPRVAIVDDDAAVVRAVTFQLEGHGYSVVSYPNAEAFLQDAAAQLECALVDVRMPGMTGLQLQAALASQRPDLPLVFMTGHGDVEIAVQAMKAGAVDFIEKPFEEAALLAALERAVERGREAHAAARLREEIAARHATLTHRERQVMALVVEGQSNKMIARTLDISPRTVEVYRARVMEKMEAQSLAELVRLSLGANLEEGVDEA
ncbi:response regulator transcription factor [Futiania mangrovi]|uniref:Response regulator n=1 Tax=Futiania mangrovi TaxID=2959716 RepID=A0A9J6PFM9_9PROT|nr:response regulator [Futiania mangrovii]MCP1335423.1 response regulator [Futiania mangrovii]